VTAMEAAAARSGSTCREQSVWALSECGRGWPIPISTLTISNNQRVPVKPRLERNRRSWSETLQRACR